MQTLINGLVGVHDYLYAIWKKDQTHKILAITLVLCFLLSLLLSILVQYQIVPGSINYLLPRSIFHAIEISFTLLLLIEVIGLVFTLSHSISSSLVKQIEILSLILLRSAFKQFGDFYETANWEYFEPVINMLSDAFGAMLIFFIILLIKKTSKHIPITDDPESQTQFINFKKIAALIMFVLFFITGIYDLGLYVVHKEAFNFFKNFYTILIFSDIFLVLLSLRYNFSYIVVFRNSAFAVATIIIRMALSAPIFYNIGLGILASVFVLGVTYFYNKFRQFNTR
jgi:hypothetical protein